MDERITAISADFDKDWVVSGDRVGNLLIQQISSKKSVFYTSLKAQSEVLSISILDKIVVFGNRLGQVYKVNCNLQKIQKDLLMKTKGNTVSNLALKYTDVKSDKSKIVVFVNSSKMCLQN
jgi:hypothetical protein